MKKGVCEGISFHEEEETSKKQKHGLSPGHVEDHHAVHVVVIRGCAHSARCSEGGERRDDRDEDEARDRRGHGVFVATRALFATVRRRVAVMISLAETARGPLVPVVTGASTEKGALFARGVQRA